MAVQTWVDFSNGDSLLDIRTKLNSFNASVNIEVDANATAITANIASISAVGDRVTVNEADIVSLDGRVTATEGGVAQNIADIATNAPFVPFFAYNVNTPTPLNTTTWTQTNRVVDATAEAGTYSFAHTVIHSYSSTTRSAYCRLSYDGGVNWVEFRHEPKDSTDAYPTSCSRPFVVGVGEGIDIVVQHKCESAADTLTVSLTSLMVERKV